MNYVENPMTLGEKIRNRRLELNILQKDVAQIIGVSEDSITFWENERATPQIHHYPKVTEFLGYFPYKIDNSTLGGKIKKYRYLNGVSQRELAKALGVNESTVFNYENGKHKPLPFIVKKLMRMLESHFF